MNKIEEAFQNIKKRHNISSDRLYIYPCSFNSWRDGTLLIMGFTSEGRFPVIVLKTSRDEEGNKRLVREANTITELSKDQLISAYLPEYLGIERIGSRTYHAYKGIQAFSLQQNYIRKYSGVPAYLTQITTVVIDFLAKFHRFAKAKPTNSLTGTFDDGVSFLQRNFKISNSLCELFNATREVLKSSDILIPVGQCHGDFSFYNILYSSGKLVVIDWEMYKSSECVVIDIMKLLTSFSLSYKISRYKRHNNGFRHGFMEDSKLSTFICHLLDEYLNALGYVLPSELRSALLIYSVVHLSVVETKRKADTFSFQPYFLELLNASINMSLRNIRL